MPAPLWYSIYFGVGNNYVKRLGLILLAAASILGAQSFGEMRWRSIGPYRGGRTRAAEGVPGQPNVFYIGAVNGGVWKTNDYGRTWNPIFDDQPTGSIGAIAVAPSDPNIIYVGSGEGLQRPDLSVGDGIYKSTDAGKTWTHLGLRNGQQIPRIAIDPHNPNRLFVAVLGHPYGPNEERGIFRSTDGGQTFEKVLYKDENTGGNDVVLDPANPRYRLCDDVGSAAGSVGERGMERNGRRDFQIHRRRKNLAAVDGRSAGRRGAGESCDCAEQSAGAFTPRSRLSAAREFIDLTMQARIGRRRPRMPGRRSASAEAIARCPRSIRRIRTSFIAPAWLPGNPPTPERRGPEFAARRAATIISGSGSIRIIRIIFLIVSDQGAIITVNGGETWSSWYNQPTAQMYHATADNAFPYRVCGGQQESGSACVASRGNDGEITFRDWHPVGVEEYGYAAPDPLDPDLVYGGKLTRFDRRTGQVENIAPKPIRTPDFRALRTAPVMFSPIDPHVLYFAANTLWRTHDGGRNWQEISPDLSRKTWDVPANVGKYKGTPGAQVTQRGVIYALAPSPLDINRIWAGTDDGLIHVTVDGGKNWQNVTPPQLVPFAKVSILDAGHFDAQTAYAAINTLRLDEMRPHILRTHDGGKSWTEIVNGIPDGAPVDVVREDPKRKGLLYAGTEREVYVSFDDGDHWQSLRLNMPATSIRDLIVKDDDLVAATHSRGFWILDDVTPLRQLTPRRD